MHFCRLRALKEERKNIWVFASGSGTNAAKLMEFFARHPSLKIGGLFTNRPGAAVVKRASDAGVPVFFLSDQEIAAPGTLLSLLKKHQVDGIILAGFLRKIPDDLVAAFPEKIINLHPALLPSFGGKGMYGMHVHRAVKESGADKTGITVHLVNEKYDEGRILFQAEVPVNAGDTPETIAAKVQRLEHEYFAPVCARHFSEVFGL